MIEVFKHNLKITTSGDSGLSDVEDLDAFVAFSFGIFVLDSLGVKCDGGPNKCSPS